MLVLIKKAIGVKNTAVPHAVREKAISYQFIS